VKILLVNNKKYNESTHHMTAEISAKLESKGIEILVDDDTGAVRDLDIDNVIVLGGDGTMLRAARRYGQQGVPVLGVNMGTVGFLSNIEIHEFNEYVDKFLRGDYTIDNMMMLEVNIYAGDRPVKTAYCLNELVVKSITPRMLTMNYCIDKQPCISYKGDGLIIATPAGSTAYSLSAGGPIVDPELEAIIITPLAGYAFGQKPTVISASKVLNIDPPPTANNVIISLDGQVTFKFEANHTLRVKKAANNLHLVNLKKIPFFATINKRLRKSEGLI